MRHAYNNGSSTWGLQTVVESKVRSTPSVALFAPGLPFEKPYVEQISGITSIAIYTEKPQKQTMKIIGDYRNGPRISFVGN